MLWPEPKLNAGEAEVVVVVAAGIGSCGDLLDPKEKIGPVVGGAGGDVFTVLGSAMSVGEEVGGSAGALTPKEKAG